MNRNELSRMVVLIHMDLDLFDSAQRLILRNLYALFRVWHFTAVGLGTSRLGETETLAERCLWTASPHEDFAGLVVRVELQLL